jgi:hypothetical protein
MTFILVPAIQVSSFKQIFPIGSSIRCVLFAVPADPNCCRFCGVHHRKFRYTTEAVRQHFCARCDPRVAHVPISSSQQLVDHIAQYLRQNSRSLLRT